MDEALVDPRLQGLGRCDDAGLSGISGRPKPTLLEDVLDPNRRISADYVAYSLVTNDGQILIGLLVSESAEAVTLRKAEGLEETVPRKRASHNQHRTRLHDADLVEEEPRQSCTNRAGATDDSFDTSGEKNAMLRRRVLQANSTALQSSPDYSIAHTMS